MKCGLEHGMFFSINTHTAHHKKRNDDVVAAKITIYAESDEQYTYFITKEAYQAIDHWIDYSIKCGEQISDERWLVRNLWDVTTPSGGTKELVIVPKKLKNIQGIKSLIQRELIALGIRTKLKEGKKRYEFATYHVLCWLCKVKL